MTLLSRRLSLFFLLGLLVPVLPALLSPLLSAGPAAAQDANAYFSDLPDLPVMPGLEELPEAGVSFDKPEGRIVEVYARGAVTAEEILRFYQQTLPQLGWEAAGGERFRREGEVLDLSFATEGGLVTLRCSLHPE